MVSNRVKGFLAGSAAGALALGVSFLLREVAGAAFLPEMAAQTLFSLTPGSIESRAVFTLARELHRPLC